MKRSKISEQQIAFILRQAEEGTGVEEVCRKAGISPQTYYRRRKKCGALMPWEMRRLEAAGGGESAPEASGGRSEPGQGDAARGGPKKALRPARRRELVDDLQRTWQVSARRACAVLKAGRSSYHYRSRRASQAALRNASGRSPRPGCATAIAGSMFCFGAKAGG